MLKHLLKQKVKREVEALEVKIPIPDSILNDERPVRTLDEWAKVLQLELIVYQDENDVLKIEYFENAVKNTLIQKHKLKSELNQIDE